MTTNETVEKIAMEWHRTPEFTSLKCPRCGKWLHAGSEGEALASLAGHVNMSHGKEVFSK